MLILTILVNKDAFESNILWDSKIHASMFIVCMVRSIQFLFQFQKENTRNQHVIIVIHFSLLILILIC
jgi:hypothetical protein